MNPNRTKPVIVITRPEPSASRLQRDLCSVGLVCSVLPLIKLEIDNTPIDLPLSDQVIFISPNAVDFAFQKFATMTAWLAKQHVVAVGKGTQSALEHFSIEGVVVPQHASTDGLLDLFVNRTSFGERITLIRGHNGRIELVENLKKRGFEVTALDIYRRTPIIHSALHFAEDKQFLISSASALDALRLNTQNNVKVIVTSKRLKHYAQQLGFIVTEQLDSADNHKLVEQLQA